MRYRMTFAVGLAVGYVLGSRAGRERYEQIKRTVRRIADNPRVQEAAGLAGAQVSKAAGQTKSAVKQRIPALKQRLPFGSKSDHHDTGTGWPEPRKPEETGVPY